MFSGTFRHSVALPQHRTGKDMNPNLRKRLAQSFLAVLSPLSTVNCFSSVSIQRRSGVVSTVMLKNDVTSTQIRRCSDVVCLLRGVYMVSVLSADGVG